MNVILSLLLATGTLFSPGDTLVEVREGDRLLVRGFEGTMVVETWDRPFLRATGESKDQTTFRIRRSGNTLELRAEGSWASDQGGDLSVVAPRWLGLEVTGKEADVEVRDLAGDVAVRILQGDIVFQNLSGVVEAQTVEGSIHASGMTGAAALRTGDDEIRVEGSSAALDLESVEGDIELARVTSSKISATSTEGDIEFSGWIPEGGDYRFFSHDGDIRLALGPPVNLFARVLAYGGEFDSEFPVRTRGFRSGEDLEFSLGTGGARLVVESFDGDITLVEFSDRRPGQNEDPNGH